jgi:hypothetical protein
MSLALVLALVFLTVSIRPAFALTATTTIICASPATVGSPTNCTITVSGSGPPPTGTVGTFTTSGAGTFNPTSCPLTSGSCTVAYTPTTVTGTPHTIGATYSGDSNYGTSMSTGGGNGAVTVNKYPSSVAVGCVPSTVIVGSSSTCTATVIGYNPTGTVSFIQASGTATTSLTTPATCPLVSGSCGVSVSTSGVGGAGIVATYQNDTNNLSSTSPSTTLTVNQASSTTQVVCSPPTLVVGQTATCTATVTGYSPTGIISWLSSDSHGIFSSNPCTISSGSCGVTYTPTASATITATYPGDRNNVGSSGTFSITANINDMIQITVANSGPPTTVNLSGCSVTPTTVAADGAPHSFQASSGCSPVTVTLPPAGTNTRYRSAAGGTSLSIGACSASSCATFSATIYYQTQNTYQAAPKSPSSWSSAGSIIVTGTSLGVGSATVCTISVSTGAGQFSCQGWTDSNTPAVMGPLSVSGTQRWATSQASFTDTTGGNQHSSNYYSQVLELFGYSLVGSTTAPTAPSLTFTAFGTGTIFPLIGSASSIWLDSGSGWSVPTDLVGSTATERWESSVTSGSATAGQTLSFVYYHQFMVNFGFSVTGAGTAFAPPSVSFVSSGSPSSGVQSWVDAGSVYNYTNPLQGSTAIERWFTATPGGSVAGAGPIVAAYYHQYAFSFSFSVKGGGLYSNPRVDYTALGTASLSQVGPAQTTVWIDSGANWGVTPLLPSSTANERWITQQSTSGASVGPSQAQFLYYHQYLGTIHYSIQGAGGSPRVPQLNYTTFGASLSSPLATSGGPFWMDSGSTWAVPLLLPGGQGERWLSNVTGSVAAIPFQTDAQYTHQFFVQVGVSTPAGGSVANTNQWRDQGSTTILNATSAKMWSFKFWQGATPFSYNGTELLAQLLVTGPANETAIFFPGLTIYTDDQGSVGYSFGKTSGTVPPGSNSTIYVPPGRDVTLTALPNTVDIMFGGWMSQTLGLQIKPLLALDSPGSAQSKASVAINSPTAIHASFATDYNDIRTFAIASLGVFIAASYIFVVKRGFVPKIK